MLIEARRGIRQSWTRPREVYELHPIYIRQGINTPDHSISTERTPIFIAGRREQGHFQLRSQGSLSVLVLVGPAAGASIAVARMCKASAAGIAEHTSASSVR
jgi:hypothetical protein